MSDPWAREEWEDGPDTFEGTCERCGEVHPLQMVVDPFEVEGVCEGTGEKLPWCHECTRERFYDT